MLCFVCVYRFVSLQSARFADFAPAVCAFWVRLHNKAIIKTPLSRVLLGSCNAWNVGCVEIVGTARNRRVVAAVEMWVVTPVARVFQLDHLRKWRGSDNFPVS